MAAITPFHTEKCCHLVSEHEESAAPLSSIVHQFLIYSTFLIVYSTSIRTVFVLSDFTLLTFFLNFDLNFLCLWVKGH